MTVDVRTDEPDLRFAAGSVLRAEPPRDAAPTLPATITVAGSRWHGNVLLLRLDQVPDRTAAEAVRGTLLHATLADDVTPEDPDEYYAHQIEGLTAVDTDGRELGVVTRLFTGAAQDLLTVRTPEGRDALVPFVSALVPEVDLRTGRIVIADRPGLVTPFPDET